MNNPVIDFYEKLCEFVSSNPDSEREKLRTQLILLDGKGNSSWRSGHGRLGSLLVCVSAKIKPDETPAEDPASQDEVLRGLQILFLSSLYEAAQKDLQRCGEDGEKVSTLLARLRKVIYLG